MDLEFIQKYNVPGPRYTSYPTVPHWDTEGFNLADWKLKVKTTFIESNNSSGISLYIHLPFCESLCTFCGCNKRITKRHDVEIPYIETVLKEWQLYVDLLEDTPVLKHIHLGGGTPTFFSHQNLEYLITNILKTAKLPNNYEFSFEGHPNNTTRFHLQTLFDLGFRRVSYGIQDYNENVQKAINRKQTFAQVERVTKMAREIGYTSVGHDLIYGLPNQKLQDVLYTMEKTKELAPDRIAFYSYAHVPWIKGNGQRGYSEADLPTGDQKLTMYETGKKQLHFDGYKNIGMDHFALKSDNLYKALNQKSLHRNFMGYTDARTDLMIGLGVSSIGDSWTSFNQNVKSIESYTEMVHNNKFPLEKGHLLSEQDLMVRNHILNLMCNYETNWTSNEQEFFNKIPVRMFPLVADGLVSIKNNTISVTPKGKPFIRNICMTLDQYLINSTKKQFSQTI
ncbi:oxygen-independent coproporphyrinogen III oxidase [Flavobacteriaceae bacterium]|nr:oxygen-independent coproporphyrinogen III oxidase [Flavobacteriaceae bacterium]